MCICLCAHTLNFKFSGFKPSFHMKNFYNQQIDGMLSFNEKTLYG